MSTLALVYLFIIAIHHVVSETENVSIKTSHDVPTITGQELAGAIEKRFAGDEYGETGDIISMMFTRGKNPPRIKWGKGDYTIKQQKQIVEAHNAYRKGVTPSSSNMNEILWNPRLAELAQKWSDACFYEHPPNGHRDYEGIGQNLYIKYLDRGGENPPSATKPVDEWYNEVQYYDYNSDTCGYVCGHYTQVVWAETTKVGCGMKFCPIATDYTKTYENAWLVTCNYSPGGNMLGKKPYKSGKPCSECEKGFCMRNLCSKCKPPEPGCECNMECKNGGQFNASKCTCTCADGYQGLSCKEHCEDKNRKCGANPGWPKRWCNDAENYPFVQEFCPALCGACTPA